MSKTGTLSLFSSNPVNESQNNPLKKVDPILKHPRADCQNARLSWNSPEHSTGSFNMLRKPRTPFCYVLLPMNDTVHFGIPFPHPDAMRFPKNIQGKAKTTSPQVRIIIFDSGAIGLRLRCTSSRFLCCRIALLNICRSMQIGSTFRFAYFCIRCGWLVFFSYLLHGWFFIKF